VQSDDDSRRKYRPAQAQCRPTSPRAPIALKPLRVGVASILQETNTFSPAQTTLADFAAQRIMEGDAVRDLIGTNTEAGGALEELSGLGVEPVPIFRAWAMSGGPIVTADLEQLTDRFHARLNQVGDIDALVLALHGAFVTDTFASADLHVLRAARDVLGGRPIGVSLDLHANLTTALVESCAFIVGYHTYPHVDMAATGARVARILVATLKGECSPITRIAKRPMLIQAEAQADEGPFGALRRIANKSITARVLDISLFPVQPWLDVAGLGYGVTVTTDSDADLASETAEAMATAAWEAREDFATELVEPDEAIARARTSSERPVLLTESADSPTAGAAADSPVMITSLLKEAPDLRSYMTLVDADAVEASFDVGVGAHFNLRVGSSVDPRFHEPVRVDGTVVFLGDGPYRLTGPVFTGMEFSMGRYARIDSGRLSILITERPACTFDPEAFRQAGLEPAEADIIVVRSAHMYRAGWAGIADESIVLDLPGASTPRLSSLSFERATRPLYPIDL
jgi:microcystin degradation protein MlrC